MEGAIPRVACNGRLSSRRLPFSEPSATIVWKALYRHGLADSTILWNALQLHPFRAEPWTNRTPTPAELAYGVPALKLLRDAFPEAVLVAVGRKAEQALAELGVSVGAAVRHPANGGATEFAEGLARLVTK
jgi:uracil-DNA glycosylase